MLFVSSALAIDWTTLTGPAVPATVLNAISPASLTKWFAVGDLGTVLQSNSVTGTYTQVAAAGIPATADLRAVYTAQNSNVVVVGGCTTTCGPASVPVLYYSSDNGATFSTVAGPWQTDGSTAITAIQGTSGYWNSTDYYACSSSLAPVPVAPFDTTVHLFRLNANTVVGGAPIGSGAPLLGFQCRDIAIPSDAQIILGGVPSAVSPNAILQSPNFYGSPFTVLRAGPETALGVTPTFPTVGLGALVNLAQTIGAGGQAANLPVTYFGTANTPASFTATTNIPGGVAGQSVNLIRSAYLQSTGLTVAVGEFGLRSGTTFPPTTVDTINLAATALTCRGVEWWCSNSAFQAVCGNTIVRFGTTCSCAALAGSTTCTGPQLDGTVCSYGPCAVGSYISGSLTATCNIAVSETFTAATCVVAPTTAVARGIVGLSTSTCTINTFTSVAGALCVTATAGSLVGTLVCPGTYSVACACLASNGIVGGLYYPTGRQVGIPCNPVRKGSKKGLLGLLGLLGLIPLLICLLLCGLCCIQKKRRGQPVLFGQHRQPTGVAIPGPVGPVHP